MKKKKKKKKDLNVIVNLSRKRKTRKFVNKRVIKVYKSDWIALFWAEANEESLCCCLTQYSPVLLIYTP